MKVLITGGGTGGHIYPALAIAKKIREKHNNSKILYVGTKGSMEEEIVPKEGFEFTSIRVKGFKRKLSLDTLHSIGELFLGLNDARRVIKEFSPDIVIGTGGYVCGPLVFTASLKGIPTLIHEQNAFPGVTNRILSRFVDKIAVSFKDSYKYFKDSRKVVLTGNPIRKDILDVDKILAYKTLNVDTHKKLVLSFGGSWGQRSLNNAMKDVIIKNINNKNLQIIHVTGKRLYNNFIEEIEKEGIDLNSNKNIQVKPYLYEMPLAQAISDIAIISAGAISIAEVTALGKPSIVIPKAYTTDNHQEYNARALEKNDAAIMFLENELNGEKLNDVIIDLLNNNQKLSMMANNSKKLGITNASDKIMDIVEELLNMK